MEILKENAPLQLNTVSQEDGEFAAKKPYTQPKLEEYGRLQNVTLNGSPGSGDSANMLLEQE